jgi:hypothetical protein
MDARYTLVRIYLFVLRHYRGRLAATAGRQSNNDQPDFTDEEVLTVYLFGLFKKRETVSDIHEYAEDHFSDWFPDLRTQSADPSGGTLFARRGRVDWRQGWS